MRLIALLRRMYLLVAGVALIQPAVHSRFLPAEIAVQFGLDGLPNRFAPTLTVVVAQVLVILLLTVIIVMVVPRRTDSHDVIRLSLWVGLVTVAFLMAMAELVYAANARPPRPFDVELASVLLLSYLAFVALLAWRLTQAPRPDASRDA